MVEDNPVNMMIAVAQLEHPRARAASTYSRLVSLSASARMTRATVHPAGRSDSDDDDGNGGAEQGQDVEHHEECRNRHESVGGPHEQEVEPASDEPTNQSDHGSHSHRHQHGNRPDQKIDPAAVHQANQNVPTQLVRAQQMTSGDGAEGRGLDVHGCGVAGHHDGPDHGEQHHG